MPAKLRRRLLVTATLAAAVAPMLSPAADAASAPSPQVSAAATTPSAYLTLLFGRGLWSVAGNCNPLPNSYTLADMASTIRTVTRTGIGTAAIVHDRVSDTVRNCDHRTQLYPTWQDYVNLRTTYGWKFISAGTHANMTTLTPAEQQQESCGSIPIINNKIGAGADVGTKGMFAYPNNKWTTQIQTDVVSPCFYWGRRYRDVFTAKSQAVAPYFQNTASINGGPCNDASQSCYTFTNPSGRRYDDPAHLAALMQPTAGKWSVVQMYRFVGAAKFSGAGPTWDCTAADWRLHWTSQDEVYCYNDYVSALRTIPASVTITDPETVGRDWQANRLG